MSPDVYQRLRERLDNYSIGFPATPSGVEIKILRKLFTEADAEMFLDLTMILETPESIAGRTGRDLDTTTTRLEAMTENGLVFRWRKEGVTKYAAAPFVAGVFEYQVKTMDKELASLVEEFGREGFHQSIHQAPPFMRPIPINRSLPVRHPVATYEDSRRIVGQQKLIAVAECICRKQQKLIDQGCDKPLEACLVFGSHAKYYMDKGMARQVSVEETYAILEQAEEAGLVTQPFNTINPGGMCNCCGDCCGVLRALNKMPRPADVVISNYFAVLDTDSCTGCETCLSRCQMAAISMNDDGRALIDLARCIGCGLCVTNCPTEAISLETKPEDRRQRPPESPYQQAEEMARRRGKSLMF